MIDLNSRMDKNFDDLAENLKLGVYGSGKGKVRLSVLKYDITRNIPEIECKKNLSILDAGGGMGQISRWLAAKGHEVLLADVSEQMLAIAKEENIKESLQDKIKIVRAAIQELPQLLKGQTFDLILLHGVIEWMENPIEGFECLIPLLKPNGVVSLLFHNLDKLIMKWGINSQYEKALPGKPCKTKKLTPNNSLSYRDLEPVFDKNRFDVVSKAGVRIFYGFFAKLTTEAVDETFELEKKYLYTEPFASMGEHIHYILRKKS